MYVQNKKYIHEFRLYTVDLVIFECLNFRKFVILGLLRGLEFANIIDFDDR